MDKSSLIRYINGTSPDGERKRVVEWIGRSGENREFYYRLKMQVFSDHVKHYSEPDISEKILQRIRQKDSMKILKPLLSNRFLKYAACLIVLIGITSIIFLTVNIKSQPPELITINVPENGHIRLIELEDGTTIWLNTNSTFSYPASFRGRERVVYIEGEAFFNVASDKRTPFLVKSSSSLEIKVTGTSFNVNTSDVNGEITTSLMEGGICMTDIRSGKNTQVLPGNHAIFNRETGNIIIRKIESEAFMNWRRGVVLVSNAELKDIAKTISGIYNVDLKIKTSVNLTKKYDFVIRRDQPLETVLEMLTFVAPVNYSILDSNTIEITLKRNK